MAEAARLFSQYLAHNPWSSEALYLCAVCELKVGRLAEALAHLAAIPDDYAHKANSLLLQAMALNKLGTTGQIKATLRRVCSWLISVSAGTSILRRPSASGGSC